MQPTANEIRVLLRTHYAERLAELASGEIGWLLINLRAYELARTVAHELGVMAELVLPLVKLEIESEREALALVAEREVGP